MLQWKHMYVVMFIMVPTCCQSQRSVPFHLVWTSPEHQFQPWRASILQRIWFYHANADVLIYSNTLSKGTTPTLKKLADAGYNFTMLNITGQLFEGTPLQSWWAMEKHNVKRLEQGGNLTATRPYLYSHLTDFLRMLLLYKHGGVYLDFDVMITNPLVGLQNFIGFQTRQPVDVAIGCAIIGFQKHHWLLEDMLQAAAVAYNASLWDSVGPLLWTSRICRRTFPDICYPFSQLDHPPNCDVHVYPERFFFPIKWDQLSLLHDPHKYNATLHAALLRNALAMHLWNKAGGSAPPAPGSLAWRLQYPQDDLAIRAVMASAV